MRLLKSYRQPTLETSKFKSIICVSKKEFIMNFRFYFIVTFYVCFLNFLSLKCISQSYIKFHGLKINYVDKQNKKQGNWIFFDNKGDAIMSLKYKNDSCASPIIFYENGDTAFVRFQRTDSVEPFVLIQNKISYYGNFIITSDSTSRIEIDQDSVIDNSIINKIKMFKNKSIEPVFYFAQKKTNEILFAGFSSSKIIFNKKIIAYLTINSSGVLTNVEFPRNKNDLSSDEEIELSWIYSKLSIWQPYFRKNKTITTKISFSNNSSLSIISYDH